jgi:hypothetical protein
MSKAFTNKDVFGKVNEMGVKGMHWSQKKSSYTSTSGEKIPLKQQGGSRKLGMSKDFKTRDRAIGNRLKAHNNLMQKYNKAGMSKESASKRAYKELFGN